MRLAVLGTVLACTATAAAAWAEEPAWEPQHGLAPSATLSISTGGEYRGVQYGAGGGLEWVAKRLPVLVRAEAESLVTPEPPIDGICDRDCYSSGFWPTLDLRLLAGARVRLSDRSHFVVLAGPVVRRMRWYESILRFGEVREVEHLSWSLPAGGSVGIGVQAAINEQADVRVRLDGTYAGGAALQPKQPEFVGGLLKETPPTVVVGMRFDVLMWLRPAYGRKRTPHPE